MITIFHYDETAGHYIGRGIAPGNPGDPDSPLIPAHSTTKPPPEGRVRYDEEKSEWVAQETVTPTTDWPTIEALEAAEVVSSEPKTEEPGKVEEAPKAAPSKRSRKSRRK